LHNREVNELLYFLKAQRSSFLGGYYTVWEKKSEKMTVGS
jgi:hypothetical protein